MELPLDQQRPRELEWYRQRLMLSECALEAFEGSVEIPTSGVEHGATAESDCRDPRCRHGRRRMFHGRDHRRSVLDATKGQGHLDPIALELEPRRMPGAGLLGEVGRLGELSIRRSEERRVGKEGRSRWWPYH